MLVLADREPWEPVRVGQAILCHNSCVQLLLFLLGNSAMASPAVAVEYTHVTCAEIRDNHGVRLDRTTAHLPTEATLNCNAD